MIKIQDLHVSGINKSQLSKGLKGAFINLLRGKKRDKSKFEIPILRGIDLTIEPGERVGFIGRNGSGKSSLLKAIAGIYPSQKGSVDVTGNVVPIIEMGVGFNPTLSGRDNIKLGLLFTNRLHLWSEELEKKIIDFSELEEKIEWPVKYYSSGMRSRLAFSVSAICDAEILILDEVFAAGDGLFVKKSKSLMEEKINSANITLMVSHNNALIRKFCKRSIWIDGGKVRSDGETEKVLQEYESYIEKK